MHNLAFKGMDGFVCLFFFMEVLGNGVSINCCSQRFLYYHLLSINYIPGAALAIE